MPFVRQFDPNPCRCGAFTMQPGDAVPRMMWSCGPSKSIQSSSLQSLVRKNFGRGRGYGDREGDGEGRVIREKAGVGEGKEVGEAGAILS